MPVLNLLEKYADVPMSIADACLVRLTEILPAPFFSPPTPTSGFTDVSASG